MSAAPGRAPILVACSHGTAEQTASNAIRELADGVRGLLEVEVREAFVDVQEPRVAEVVAGIPAGSGVSAVVVPLLLSGGYHVHVDIARAVRGRADVVAAPALGPDPRLVAILLDRLAAADVNPGAAVVLGAAGSSDERSRGDTLIIAELLGAARPGPVTLGFAAGVRPTVEEAVAAARAAGSHTVAVASYLLAPGTFQARLARAGADAVTNALAPDSRLVDIVADRYRAAAAAGAK